MLEETEKKIKAAGFSIIRSEAGNDANDQIKTLENLGIAIPPEEILDFYRNTNGITLIWQGNVTGTPIAGSLNILSVFNSCLRTPLNEGGMPNEGLLWSEDTPDPTRTELQKMTIFEAIAGRDDNLTYIHGEKPLRAYFTRGWTIQPLSIPFNQLIRTLIHFGGADTLRDHLLAQDWKERIMADKQLINVFGMPDFLL